MKEIRQQIILINFVHVLLDMLVYCWNLLFVLFDNYNMVLCFIHVQLVEFKDHHDFLSKYDDNQSVYLTSAAAVAAVEAIKIYLLILV